MFPHPASCRSGRLYRNVGTRIVLVSVAFCLIWSAAPLWSQTVPKPTFAEIEKQATEAREANRLEDAIALYREGLKVKPSWSEGSWYLGTSLYGLKRYDEARDAFRHLAISQPGNGPAWALAGMCEFEIKNYDRALEYLLRSESAGFGTTSSDNSGQSNELAYLVRFRIALLLNRTGDPGEALERLIPIAAQGTYPEVIEALGLSLLRAPLLPAEVPEQDRDLYMRAGEAMNAYVTHDKASATRLFNELVEAYPDKPNVHYARGVFLMETDPEKAFSDLQRELELNPAHSAAMEQLAKLYVKQGSPEKALPYARQAVKARPNAAEPRRVLGESLLQTGDAAAAIQELLASARLDPAFPQTHFLLAQAYKHTGNKISADREMAEFERLDKKQKSEFSSSNPAN